MMRFGWGPGPGHRMLAPGFPDALFADGACVGWLNRDGAWRLRDDHVAFAPISEPKGIVVTPSGWAVLSGKTQAWELHHINWDTQTVARHEFRARSVMPGCRWIVLDTGWERKVHDLLGTETPRTPTGAREAKPQPWPGGQGLVWVGGTTVYRMGDDTRVRVAGSLPVVPEAFNVGPGGSAVFATKNGVWGMAPLHPITRLPDIAFDSLRFSPDGQRVLGLSEGGVVEADLRTGSVLRAHRGDLQPVGYAPGAVVLEERTGAVRTLEGEILAGGFCPSASGRVGSRLYGPGGTAWDLEAGKAIWSHAPLKSEHLAVVGEHIVCVDHEFEIYDEAGERRRHCAVPIESDTEGPIYDVRADPPDHVLLELEDEVIRVGLDGQRIGTPLPLDDVSEEPQEQVDESGRSWTCSPDQPAVTCTPSGAGLAVEWPIYAEQVAAVGDRGWCWNDDGMLIGLSL